MARNLDPKCKQCRREGKKLFLKGERCYTQKCAMIKKAYPPGMHRDKRRRGASEYGLQLREKQKVKRIYGVLERQFNKYFKEASQKKENIGEVILRFLEMRFDNVVYRLGFASSRSQARQLVSHNHFLINNKRVNVASYRVKVNDIISVKKSSLNQKYFKDLKGTLKNHQVPSWLSLDKDKLKGKVVALPKKEDIESALEMQLVVEYYSR